MNKRDFAWEQKYRPTKVSECVFSNYNRKIFDGIIKEGNIPNLILAGLPGLGKTTISLILPKELGYDYKFINGRTEGNIDNLRHDITDFVERRSMGGKRKVVIFDEGDGASTAVLDALKTMIEKYSSNASFIITTNHLNKFKHAIKSRMVLVEFDLTSSVREQMESDFFKRIIGILKKEGTKFRDKSDVASLKKFISRHFPDMRHTIKTLQMISITDGGHVSTEYLDRQTIFNIDEFKEMLKGFKYEEITKFAENASSDMLFLFVQENIKCLTDDKNYYKLLRLVNDYSFQGSFTTVELANKILFLEDISKLMC